MKSGDNIPITIPIQGPVGINHAYVYAWGETVCAAVVDMSTKRGDVLGTGSDENDIPLIIVEPNECSVHLVKDAPHEATEIDFPTLKGWDVWTAEVSKYSILICFVKSDTWKHATAPAARPRPASAELPPLL